MKTKNRVLSGAAVVAAVGVHVAREAHDCTVRTRLKALEEKAKLQATILAYQLEIEQATSSNRFLPLVPEKD